MEVAIFVPSAPDFDARAVQDAAVYTYDSAPCLVSLIEERPYATAVLVSDGLAAGTESVVAAAIRLRGQPVIEVRAGRWDGVSPSPLSAACRGVISGFGVAGVTAAAHLLASEAATSTDQAAG